MDWITPYRTSTSLPDFVSPEAPERRSEDKHTPQRVWLL